MGFNSVFKGLNILEELPKAPFSTTNGKKTFLKSLKYNQLTETKTIQIKFFTTYNKENSKHNAEL